MPSGNRGLVCLFGHQGKQLNFTSRPKAMKKGRDSSFKTVKTFSKSSEATEGGAQGARDDH